jgi:hypothetical protein
MSIKGIIASLIGLILVIILFYSFSGEEDVAGYISHIREEREKKDKFMQSDESPLGEEKTSFKGLQYFEPDIRYRIQADLEPIRNKQVVVLPTSTGEENSYLEYAWANFTWEGKPQRLLLLEIMATGPTRGKLFLAFADETSARETYGAGRYIDVNKTPGSGTIQLDFNLAYNPYCAYTNNFSCPFPPRENVLTFAVNAGEKTYH